MNFPVTYEGMCRTCLRKSETLADIFVSEKTNTNLSSAIMECAPIHIVPGDGMPSQICSDCVDKLQIAHRFREMCLQADRTLRQYLTVINTPINNMPVINSQPQVAQRYELPVKVELVTPTDEESLPNPNNCMEVTNKEQNNSGNVDSSNHFMVGFSRNTTNEPETKITTLKTVNFHTTPEPKNDQKQRFNCDVCEKSFPVNNALIKHYRIHSGERPYKCNICGKDFNCSSTLSVHIRFHNNDRRYKCTICDKSYVVKSHLTVHMRSHTGEHPYSCHVCDKRFRISKSLTRHLKNNTCERVVSDYNLHKLTF